jgi:hypothetical protein
MKTDSLHVTVGASYYHHSGLPNHGEERYARNDRRLKHIRYAHLSRCHERPYRGHDSGSACHGHGRWAAEGSTLVHSSAAFAAPSVPRADRGVRRVASNANCQQCRTEERSTGRAGLAGAVLGRHVVGASVRDEWQRMRQALLAEQ